MTISILPTCAFSQMQFHHKDEIQHRRKRKIINHFYPTRKWPVEIEFYFEDTFSAGKIFCNHLKTASSLERVVSRFTGHVLEVKYITVLPMGHKS